MSRAVAKSSPREPMPELGPAMRVLPARWRVAVLALFDTKGDRSMALRLAGYKTTKPDALHVMASRIFADQRVRLAIREECVARIDGAEPELIELCRQIMHDPEEKTMDRLRAVSMLWDRSNPIVQKHKVDVTHHLSVEEIEIQHYRALERIGAPSKAFINRFGPNGVARVRALIAAEVTKANAIEEGETLDDIEYDELPAEEISEFDEEMLP
jgi:hypothetical protein